MLHVGPLYPLAHWQVSLETQTPISHVGSHTTEKSQERMDIVHTLSGEWYILYFGIAILLTAEFSYAVPIINDTLNRDIKYPSSSITRHMPQL